MCQYNWFLHISHARCDPNLFGSVGHVKRIFDQRFFQASFVEGVSQVSLWFPLLVDKQLSVKEACKSFDYTLSPFENRPGETHVA
ncbi:hypothetical protein NPIL_230681 [Nephila pilipes]|uniref:Uncharacterized protein n=1 Tax=Nephila pilipes TaxID=299642 RepID=A0A8X6PMJ1_NEPPI|nr:hypothetical protein NPIL_230681 [Nephila pilipes]